jgi:hypothetical protein
VSMISVLAVSLAEHIPKIRFRAYMKMVKAWNNTWLWFLVVKL